METISKKIGFRKIIVDGRRLLVNGKEVKLRGRDSLTATRSTAERSIPVKRKTT